MKQLFKFFSDNPPTFGKINSTQMNCGGKRYDYATEIGLSKLFNADTILKYKLFDLHDMPSTEKINYLIEYINTTFRPDILKASQRNTKVKDAIENSIVKLPSTDWLLENLIPARAIGETKKESGFCFIDKTTNRVTEYDYYSVFYALSRDLEDKQAKLFMQNFVQIKPVYNPHGKWSLEEVEGANNLYIVNTYQPPYWMELDDLEAELPLEIEKLFLHLFPQESSREFVYSWFYYSITSRAQTFLYLCGGQGSGKNTLAKLLMALHGEKNSSAPKQDSIKGRFNNFLRDKRFVFLDEYNCRRRQDKDLLKSIINDRIQIEGKGQDHEDINVHASFMIANNSREAIGLDPIDRRFSVPNISDENLLNSHSSEWISTLLSSFDNSRYIGSFAKWLIEEYKDSPYTALQPFQGSRYETIVMDTARVGFEFTLSRILSKEDIEYSYTEEKDIFEAKFRGRGYPHISDWQKFFADVKLKGSYLGHLEGKIFTPRIEYQNSELDEDQT